MLTRSIQGPLSRDLDKKIILLSGPRQVGKTSLSKMLSKSFDYLNFDSDEDRRQILAKEWDRHKALLVLDEIHKMNKWKQWLKGIFDKEGIRPRILVTGSARLDIVKKMGDSLAGRHFQYRLHPFDLKELKGTLPQDQIYQRLLNVSGFPEPFFENSERFYSKWSRSHLDLILRQDLLDLESVREIKSIETLVTLLESRVGSPLSINSLAEDLHRDPKTVAKWIEILERLFVVFRVHPFSRNISRAIVKMPKLYFYDLCRVQGDEGVRLENLVALAFKKEVDFLNDALGITSELYTLRLKESSEVDFMIARKGKPSVLCEVKLSDDSPSPSFFQFDKFFKSPRKIQLVKNLKREKTTESGVEIRSALHWLSDLNLAK